MKRVLLSFISALGISSAMGAVIIEVNVSNRASISKKDAPVVVNIGKYNAKSALVTCGGKEISSQMDDLDGDGTYDELCFVADFSQKQKQTFVVTLYDEGTPKNYTPRVYAQMMLTNKNVKIKNKQNLFIKSMTVENGTNPYSTVHHHGPAFESELVAYRIYFDHRQTVDLYGKYYHRLELKETQFYPDDAQKASKYGDDVLWAGQSFGLGAMRGWDGESPRFLEDVDLRTESVLAKGPVRTIVEIIDRGWNTCNAGKDKITMTTRYILYAGHRDCIVDVRFDRSIPDYRLATGILNISGSSELSDHKGLRGCWGANWTVAAKDTLGHKKEVIGLGICIPQENIAEELAADATNYPFVVKSSGDRIRYGITFCSDNEINSSYHSSAEWFDYLKEWKHDFLSPLEIEVRERK
ncbi:MAG: DUF4861 domain-containing protein [Prevotella sp.]|nr:DUF4861 domain-containing protein [Prevotella sp.]